MVCVLLKITPSSKIFDDEWGNKDVQGSFYVTENISPNNIEFWNPDTKSWESVLDWEQLVSGPEIGIRESYIPEGEDTEIHFPYEWEQKGGFKP